MRVLGIDPGSLFTGYGIIEYQKGKMQHIDNGCIIMKSSQPFFERLAIIHQQLKKILETFQPEQVAIEKIFKAQNVESLIKLGHARGVIALTVVQQEIPIFEYSALEVKQSVVGYGRATKKQVIQMVKEILLLPEAAQEDASDALALAICHTHSIKISQRLGIKLR